jgi:signal transduction histidine kinase
MERGRTDSYTSWLLGLTLIVFLLGAASTLFVGSPWFKDAYELPQARLVLETAIAIAAAAVAVLAGTRFAVEGRRVDLLLCSGFAVAALGGLAFDVVPSMTAQGGSAAEAWSGLLARVLAAALVAAAAFATGRIVDRRRAMAVMGAAVVSALATDWAVLRLRGDTLPLVEPGATARPAVLTATLALLASLALLATIGFGLRYRRERKDLDSWLTLAATLTLFADLHYVLTPTLSTEFLLHGDFLRVLAYGTLLVGVWRGIRAAEFGRAVAEERARVAREIHDGLAQYLFALSTHASMLEAGAPLDQVLPKLKHAAAQAQQEARFAVLALSSASGTAPFDAALRRYVEFLTSDGELAVDVEIEPHVALAPDEQIEVFRIVQESLANVRRHAGASRAEVLIGERSGRRIVRVRDDGIGFDGEQSPAGQGLRNMRRRAESIEGGFSLRSLPGRGTALEVVLRA